MGSNAGISTDCGSVCNGGNGEYTGGGGSGAEEDSGKSSGIGEFATGGNGWSGTISGLEDD